MQKDKNNQNSNNFNTEGKDQESKPITKRQIAISRIKRRLLKHLWLVRIGIIASFLLVIYLLLLVTGSFFENTKTGQYIGLAKDFVFAPVEKVETLKGRTNILILGKGGQGHEAPDLTDTVILVSIKYSPPSVTLISLSRDIWVPELRTKLNSIYYWGNQKTQGGGLILAKSTVEQIVGVPVHYGAVVDFSGFQKIINVLGGIKVEVERSFIDERYPIAGKENDDCGGEDEEFLCRYEVIRFEAGTQTMDGETALKFARSRNAEGEEGTDFARAARQEKVLTSITNKALSRGILLNPKKVIDVVNAVLDSMETDINLSVAAILARKVFEARDVVVTKVLPEELLENPPKSSRFDNLYVFIPKGETWEQVHQWVECILKNGSCEQ